MHRPQRSLSLLELTISIAVFVIALLGLASLLLSSSQTESLLRERAAAASAANEKLEEIAAFPDFDQLSTTYHQTGFNVMIGPDRAGLDDGSGQALLIAGAAASFPAGYPGGTQAGYVEIQALRTDLVEARATVVWRSATNGEERLTYLIRIAREE